jgi:anti-sigma regulatory factor (Ser/Thr protein kinase)
MSKKVTNKDWLDKRSKKLNKSKYHRRFKKGFSSGFNSNDEPDAKSKTSYYLKAKQSIKIVPTNFSLVENPVETINFFDDIIREIEQRTYKNTFRIDSSGVEHVTVDALIYLIAIMQNIKINYDMLYTFSGNLPRNESAAFIYKNSGFMSYVSSKTKTLPKSTDNMRIVSNCINDPIVTKELCQFIMEKLHKDRREILSVQKILIELMSNVYHHAYNNDDIMINRWYLYAEHVDNHVRCVFLDTGASIAKTVRKNYIEKLQRRIGINDSDSDLIFSTLQGDFRTQTGEAHRGNGLFGVRELAETPLFQNFSVISGYGHCYLNDKNELIKQDYDNKIYGTIYMFDVI